MRLSDLDSIVIVWLALQGVVTLIAFGLDKRRASRSQRRVPRVFYVCLPQSVVGLAGGWA